MPEIDKMDFLTDYESFSKIISSKGVTLMTFGVPWSAACNIQNSIADKVSILFKENVHFGSVDIENVPTAKSKYNIHNVPTVVIFRNGSELKRFSGVQPEKTLAKELNAVTGYYDPEQQTDVVWEEMLDREREKMLLHKEIMVVDDDPDITFCVITILKEAKFNNVAIANDYKSAMDQIKQNRPDLIFLNISMHNKEGNKTLFALQRDRNLCGIPILVSVGPLEPTRVYEDSFREAVILRHGKYAEHPTTRDSFIKLVRHMLLYKGEISSTGSVLNIGSICPPDRNGM